MTLTIRLNPDYYKYICYKYIVCLTAIHYSLLTVIYSLPFRLFLKNACSICLL